MSGASPALGSSAVEQDGQNTLGLTPRGRLTLVREEGSPAFRYFRGSRRAGKFARMRQLCAVIASRQEKALVFSQFREACKPLEAFLSGVFGVPGRADPATAAASDRWRASRVRPDASGPLVLVRDSRAPPRLPESPL